MAQKGLLIHYQFCSGCRSCELACRNEHDFPEGVWGIRVREEEPWKLPDGSWNWDYIPVPTALCDLCAEREAAGHEPMCVQSCQAKVMRMGTLEELSAIAADKGNKVVVFVP